MKNHEFYPDENREKAEPNNRPTHGELRIAYGKIAEARSYVLQALSHIDPLDERIDARVIPDLRNAVIRLEFFLERKMRESLEAVEDELPRNMRRKK